jgi:hypothetical protein
MDYLPPLMLFTVWGSHRFPSSFIKGAILWSTGLNLLAIIIAFLTYGVPKA